MGNDYTNGFRTIYGRGVLPREAAQWAGVRLCQCADLLEITEPPKPVATALAQLDSLSAEGPWTSPDDLLLFADPWLAYVIGADYHNCSARLRAVVVRAYAEADLVAGAFAAKRRDRLFAKSKADTFRKAREALTYIEKYHRWRWESEDVKTGRRQNMTDLETQLLEVEGELRASKVVTGRYKAVPKRFFVIRLAEVFALLSGETPTFHATGNSSTRWKQFLAAAFGAIAFPTGEQGLDRILRGIGRMHEHRCVIEDLAARARAYQKGMVFSGDDHWMRQQIAYGTLQSVGFLIDYKVPMPWERDPSTE